MMLKLVLSPNKNFVSDAVTKGNFVSDAVT